MKIASLLAPVKLDDEADVSHEYEDNVDNDGETSQKKSDKHGRLIRSIAKLDKPKLSQKKITRSEPAKAIDDQALSTGGLRPVSVSALLRKSDSSASDTAVKRKLGAVTGNKVLAEPLRQTEAKKAQRAVAYEEVSKDLKKWDPIVKANRVAEGMSFPLDQTKLHIQTTSEYVKRYQTKTELEQQIEALVGASKSNLTKTTILTAAEKEALQAMSVQEADFCRHELAKARALLSYKEQKQKWQSKIKSKNYHRHLRRGKRKEEEKSFEELQKTNPDAALEQLERLDKKRLEERHTLKHRNMGKWARHTASRAKTDKNAREALQDQLRISRKLTEKTKNDDTDEDDDDEDDEDEGMDEVAQAAEETINKEAKSNPWMMAGGEDFDQDVKKDLDIDEAFEKLEAEEDEMMEAAKKPKKLPQKQAKPLANRSRPRKPRRRSESDDDSDWVADEDNDTELVDGGEMIADTRNVTNSQTVTPKGVSAPHQKNSKQSIHDTDIDPRDVIKKVYRTDASQVGADGDGQDEDSDDEQRNLIAEAFADDNVVQEFKREKEEQAEEQKPKDIDLSLPGWGEWTGAGTSKMALKNKKKKFTVKAPKSKTRKDKFLPGVIISERHDEKIVPHQIKELPFPFTTVAQLQSTIRAPIGKTWNTESAFDELTMPKYTTKMGAIIEPLKAKNVFKRQKRKESEGFVEDEKNSALAKSEVVQAGRNRRGKKLKS